MWTKWTLFCTLATSHCRWVYNSGSKPTQTKASEHWLSPKEKIMSILIWTARWTVKREYERAKGLAYRHDWFVCSINTPRLSHGYYTASDHEIFIYDIINWKGVINYGFEFGFIEVAIHRTFKSNHLLNSRQHLLPSTAACTTFSVNKLLKHIEKLANFIALSKSSPSKLLTVQKSQ